MDNKVTHQEILKLRDSFITTKRLSVPVHLQNFKSLTVIFQPVVCRNFDLYWTIRIYQLNSAHFHSSHATMLITPIRMHSILVWQESIKFDDAWSLYDPPIVHKWRIYIPVNYTSIGSGNGLAPVRRQAIALTNADLLSIWPLGTDSNEICIKYKSFHWRKRI